jgi:hypothetical protein
MRPIWIDLLGLHVVWEESKHGGLTKWWSNHDLISVLWTTRIVDNPALCNWVLDFLTGHPQVVKVGNNNSTWGPTRVRAQPSPVLAVHQ